MVFDVVHTELDARKYPTRIWPKCVRCECAVPVLCARPVRSMGGSGNERDAAVSARTIEALDGAKETVTKLNGAEKIYGTTTNYCWRWQRTNRNIKHSICSYIGGRIRLYVHAYAGTCVYSVWPQSRREIDGNRYDQVCCVCIRRLHEPDVIVLMCLRYDFITMRDFRIRFFRRLRFRGYCNKLIGTLVRLWQMARAYSLCARHI